VACDPACQAGCEIRRAAQNRFQDGGLKLPGEVMLKGVRHDPQVGNQHGRRVSLEVQQHIRDFRGESPGCMQFGEQVHKASPVSHRVGRGRE
jgi:hypothetical protein